MRQRLRESHSFVSGEHTYIAIIASFDADKWIDLMLNEYSLEFEIKGNMIEENQFLIDE
jgi:hypothetical protein